ncbi:hypothetical protein MSAN_00238400 [Mycena sanguinolenta]|uniref:DUF6534 domain-containing protein n=1 Tax=Mycena sanguinolenta TaxID=230812 RepID=A0A8H6ZIV7_9AGAR|nr:hypothetical protein MSAN_00238400 [Mycena sanguinolenta]
MASVVQLTLPMFIGTLLNWGLFGTLLVQAYIYFSVFQKDRAWLKFIVILIVSLEVIETLSATHDMIIVFGTGWGNPEALDSVGWAWFSVPVMGSIIAFVCQVFYGWRICIIGKSPLSTLFFGLITLISLVQLGAGIWAGVIICNAGRFSLLQSDNLRATATWLATTSLADLIIVCGTVFFLRRSTDPEFTSKKTNSIVSRVIMITAETGLLCMLFALVDLFLFAKYKGTNYHLSLCSELSKLYSNGILLILNSRAHMGHECTHTTNSNYSVNLSSTLFNARVPSSHPIEVGVSVSRAGSGDYSATKMEMDV